MAINITAKASISPVPLWKPENQLFVPRERFQYVGETTGDASGGSVTFNVSVKESDMKSIYVVVKKLDGYTDDANVTFLNLLLTSTYWEDMAGLTNSLPQIRCPVALGVINSEKTVPPQSIGRAVDAGTGVLSVTFNANTDTKKYTCIIKGYLFTSPPMASSLPIF